MSPPVDAPRRARTAARDFAPGVCRLPILFANVYLVGEPGEPWVLVDTGLPWFAGRLRRRAEALFGRPPEAILLTHGHFDHAGNAEELAVEWDVPVYAHALELPFLTGRSDYPPHDPTVGGALGLLARSFPNQGIDLKRRVHPLPRDGSVPGLPGWRSLHTPGHTSGHVAFFRESDRTLLAGDAFTTLAGLLGRPAPAPPPAPFTTDWPSAAASVRLLAELRPQAIGCGHGRPLVGRRTAAKLRRFAESFTPPRRGRYVGRPARTDEHGIVSLPPPAHDPLPKQLLVAGVAAGALFALAQTLRARSRQPKIARRRNND